MVKQLRTDTSEDSPYGQEQDSCAVYLSVRKYGQSTFGTLKRALQAVANMGHRTGYVNGEGDGSGVQTDIPRQLWAKKLSQLGLRTSLATQPGFWVGHILIAANANLDSCRDAICSAFNDEGLPLLVDQPGHVRHEALSATLRAQAPTFWQIAGFSSAPDLDKRLFKVQQLLEDSLPVHFASLSASTVVYKMRGSIDTLPRYYPDLQDHDYDTAMALSHARYSTNTVSNFERAQPFALLGHNGEINTISRFRQEAEQIDVRLPLNGSDSQDVDRALHTLIVEYGLDLIEAMELVFPPVPHEIDHFPAHLRATYAQIRMAFGPYAQGPAAVVARYNEIAVFSVDALGLRPLWFGETEKEFFATSERGAVPLENMVSDARALAPGEKMALRVNRGQSVEILNQPQVRQHVVNRHHQREKSLRGLSIWAGWNNEGNVIPASEHDSQSSSSQQTMLAQKTLTRTAAELHALNLIAPDRGQTPWNSRQAHEEITTAILAAMGWQREHVHEIEEIVETGKDPISSLGFDGPLAVLSKNRVNLADAFKETVAVVTNPAIDRFREEEAFSTSTLVGARPAIGLSPRDEDLLVDCASPLLPSEYSTFGSQEAAHEIARRLSTLTIEELLAVFEDRTSWLTLGLLDGETGQDALARLGEQAIAAVRNGAQCILLDDTDTIRQGLGWLDPHLAIACVDDALRQAGDSPNLRRRAGIVIRSGSIRTLHDIALLIGFGADAINPYAMLQISVGDAASRSDDVIIETQYRLLNMLRIGLEKVTSTMGCHELRGYGRVCSSIGLAPSVAAVLGTANFLGSEAVGFTWQRLEREAAERAAEIRGEMTKPRLAHVDHFYPKFWKKVEAFAMGEIEYAEMRQHFWNLTAEIPIALRHVLGIRNSETPSDIEHADISLNDYDLPLVIGAMSFGSQGELSYRSYAEAASRLNMICVNGEGGELPEIMGLYKHNRGQQVASGRFGVNAEFLNSAAVLEIKIGQGAKPGEGGMLPAFKVNPKVAIARRTTPGVQLLSPSNNHDLYSIEDLAQLIEELKTVNPEAKISVKCPVVPNIGLIAVGIAKAGADIINMSGYDGATGAARKHALQYVGLPTEIGVIQAHRALTEAGIRDRVELWCDGGMKTGEDAVKMMLLGANRVGFATMAMVAIGCTICRKCEEGTCHVGITTHIKTVEEAMEKGLKSFVPRDYEQSVARIVRIFDCIGQEMRELTTQLGATSLQDLVGRADLLQQVRWHDYVDLSPILESLPVKPRHVWSPGVGRVLTRPRNNLTHLISDSIVANIEAGEREITYQDEVRAYDRALGSYLAGAVQRRPDLYNSVDRLHVRFGPSSIAGNGFAAWVTEKMDIVIEGGAQDGVAKGASGGRVAVMKGLNHDGLRVDGSVGKSFAYGAQCGVLIVQGNADSRVCIRLSGADVILGGEITEPIDDSTGNVGSKANLKGFACEYMTSGRVIILGDPGPYAFAGMTGGVVYQQLNPDLGLDLDALRRRLARGAEVEICQIDESDIANIQELLGHYVEALLETHQEDVAIHIEQICDIDAVAQRFVKVVPRIAPIVRPHK